MEASMLTLYYWPGASSVIPHITLEEIGAPYELNLVNLANGEHKGAAYLKINPRGKVPALSIGGKFTHGERCHPDLSRKTVP
jgi:glutathione S-transferase